MPLDNILWASWIYNHLVNCIFFELSIWIASFFLVFVERAAHIILLWAIIWRLLNIIILLLVAVIYVLRDTILKFTPVKDRTFYNRVQVILIWFKIKIETNTILSRVEFIHLQKTVLWRCCLQLLYLSVPLIYNLWIFSFFIYRYLIYSVPLNVQIVFV